MNLQNDALSILRASIQSAQPDEAVRSALSGRDFSGGRLILLAVGKAAWQMARAALPLVKADAGVVITKYKHAMGALPPLEIYEAGHPVPDENGFRATRRALMLLSGLTARDTVLVLLSGGGSALLEDPLIPAAALSRLTGRLLASGAEIAEINAVRKRLSAVKGGKLARFAAPAKVLTVALSDVLGDKPEVIASGPTVPDPSTCQEALAVLQKYAISADDQTRRLLEMETPKTLDNAEILITGSVRLLTEAAAKACARLGYHPEILTDSLDCEAREAGRFLAAVARRHQTPERPLAFLCGGETVVHVAGRGLGGRNQELALAAAPGIAGLENAAVFSFGSDGTDGPTDAAGGYVDGGTLAALERSGVSCRDALKDNDAYHALEACGGLLVTGPTGTNVNDLSAVLLR